MADIGSRQLKVPKELTVLVLPAYTQFPFGGMR